VAKLRAFGNAIDPRPASQFIAAYMEARGLPSKRAPSGDGPCGLGATCEARVETG
jgi:hypothetical protein